MSRSSLYIIDKDYRGYEDKEYKNSWLFSPIIWDILMEKYLKRYNRSPHIENDKTPVGYMFACWFNKEINISSRLNEIINNCECQVDRVLWEMAEQQVFHSKDKEFTASCIDKFIKINAEYYNDLPEHIIERFNEIANDIRNINELESPMFVWKNTSCDDNVEYWFSYNEDTDENKSLKDWNESVCEFVIIEDNKIIEFKDNLNYFKL